MLVRADDEQVEVPVVVEVHERRVDGARRKRDARSLRDVEELPPLDVIEARALARGRNEQVIRPVAVVIAQRDGPGPRSRRRRLNRGKPGVCRRVDEPHHVRSALAAPSHAQCHQGLGREGEHGTSDLRPFEPLHVVKGCLIRGGQLHQVQEAVERRSCRGELTGAQQRNDLRQLRPCFSRKLRPNTPDLLELAYGTVSHAALDERADQLEPHREVRGRDRNDLAELAFS